MTAGVVLSLLMSGYSMYRVEKMNDMMDRDRAEMDTDTDNTFENRSRSARTNIFIIQHQPHLKLYPITFSSIKLEFLSPTATQPAPSVSPPTAPTTSAPGPAPIPVMFDCSRTSRLLQRSVVTYDTCLVDTTGGAMDNNTGIFTVNKHQVTAVALSQPPFRDKELGLGLRSNIRIGK